MVLIYFVSSRTTTTNHHFLVFLIAKKPEITDVFLHFDLMSSRELEYCNKLISCPPCCSSERWNSSSDEQKQNFFINSLSLWDGIAGPSFGASGASPALVEQNSFCSALCCFTQMFCPPVKGASPPPPSLGEQPFLGTCPCEEKRERRKIGFVSGWLSFSSLLRIRGHVTGQCFVFCTYSSQRSLIVIRSSPKLNEVLVQWGSWDSLWKWKYSFSSASLLLITAYCSKAAAFCKVCGAEMPFLWTSHKFWQMWLLKNLVISKRRVKIRPQRTRMTFL